MLNFFRSVVLNNLIHQITGALFQLKTRLTSHYVDPSQLIKCLLLHASIHQVTHGFRQNDTTLELTSFISLVVGSTKWIKDKNSSKLTVEALKMSYNEGISSAEAVDKLIERAQAKLNAGI